MRRGRSGREPKRWVMGAGFRRLPRLALAAIAVGAAGYVLTFYVRSELWPWVGVLLSCSLRYWRLRLLPDLAGRWLLCWPWSR